MTKPKSTKRALLLSALALLMCVSMLVGSTFAWFTDSVTSANNKIVAGNLDVQLWMDTGDGYKDISNATESIFNMINNKAQNDNADTLWEPGKTQVAYLKIVNAGTLALKYSVALKITDVEKNLHEVMQYAITPDATYRSVTAWDASDGKNVVLGTQTVTDADVAMNPGDEHCFALSIHMMEEAGNSYQGGKLNFDLTVLAGQLASEPDSFGNTYDTLASYPGTGYATLKEGESAVEIPIRNEEDAKVGSVVIPAGAIAAGVTELEANIDESAYVPNITIAAGLEKTTFDVSVVGLKDNNDVPVKVQLRIKDGLDPATVALYHYDDEIEGITYNPETGYVTFETTGFSPFTVVYDAESKYVPPVTTPEDLPTANVTRSTQYENADLEWGSYGQWSPTDGLDSKLEAAYTFACNETLAEAELNPFARWHCDFYVKLDKDLGENEIFLGGNYGDFGWVGFHNGDITLDANEEIALLGSVTSNPWTYLDVVQNVGTFICGVGDVNNALSGATFTVMLRLTNPENETEFYNVATIKYTFGTGESVIEVYEAQ